LPPKKRKRKSWQSFPTSDVERHGQPPCPAPLLALFTAKILQSLLFSYTTHSLPTIKRTKLNEISGTFIYLFFTTVKSNFKKTN